MPQWGLGHGEDLSEKAWCGVRRAAAGGDKTHASNATPGTEYRSAKVEGLS